MTALIGRTQCRESVSLQSDVVASRRRHRAHALGAVLALGQLVGVVVGVVQLVRLWEDQRGASAVSSGHPRGGGAAVGGNTYPGSSVMERTTILVPESAAPAKNHSID